MYGLHSIFNELKDSVNGLFNDGLIILTCLVGLSFHCICFLSGVLIESFLPIVSLWKGIMWER